MPPEVASLLADRELPVWALVLVIVVYHLSTAKWAAKLPGVLGAVPRWFGRRSVRVVHSRREFAEASELLYTGEIKRVLRVNGALVEENEVLRGEVMQLRLVLADAAAFIRLIDVGRVPVPVSVVEFMKGGSGGV